MASYFARSHPLARASADAGVSAPPGASHAHAEPRRQSHPQGQAQPQPQAQGKAQPKRPAPTSTTAAASSPPTTAAASSPPTTTTAIATATANGRPARSTRDRLLGTWSLISYTAHAPSAPPLDPLGTHPRGILIYSGDGYMSAQLQAPGQRAFASPAPHGGTDAERAEAARRYLAYAGGFSVDEGEDGAAVLHHVEVSSFPNWVGGTQERLVRFEEGEEGEQVLVLRPRGETMIGGEMRVAELKWRRVGRGAREG